MRCDMGVGGSTVIGTSGDSWCTLGDRRKIGDSGIMGCRSVKGSCCLNITPWIQQTGVLLWRDVVVGGGFDRGVTTLVGGGNGVGGDATGGGTTLGGSIAAVTGGGGGMGVGCSGCDLTKIRGVESLGIGGIERGSQLINSLRSLVIAVSCSW